MIVYIACVALEVSESGLNCCWITKLPQHLSLYLSTCELTIDFSERDWDGIKLQTTLQCGVYSLISRPSVRPPVRKGKEGLVNVYHQTIS